MIYTAGVTWIDARDTVPINARPVLIVRGKDWSVDVGQHQRTTWHAHGEVAVVIYWADFPDAPPPPNYVD